MALIETVAGVVAMREIAEGSGRRAACVRDGSIIACDAGIEGLGVELDCGALANGDRIALCGAGCAD